MSVFWNTRTKNLSPYVPGEQPKDRQFIKLNTNENPYPPSPKVIEAIQNAANERLRLYPDPQCGEFREAVAARYGVKSEQVFAGNGSDEILAFAFGAFFQNGEKAEKILFPDITYSFYPVYSKLWDIPYRAVPLSEELLINTNDYKVPSGGVIFPNPNAPTGMAVLLGDILTLVEYLEKQEKVFIVDEAYAAFGAQSAVPLINKYPNLLTVHTLSKAASLAGLRVGFAIGDEKLIEGLCRIRDSFNSYTLDRLAMAGASAAVADASYYDEINSHVAATRDKTAQKLRGLRFSVLPSSANFLFVKPHKISGAEFFTALREKGILVRHFNKDRIADYLRISIGTDEDMDALLAACGEIVGKKQ
jgi:histidinol-phosphate aminotransferase